MVCWREINFCENYHQNPKKIHVKPLRINKIIGKSVPKSIKIILSIVV